MRDERETPAHLHRLLVQPRALEHRREQVDRVSKFSRRRVVVRAGAVDGREKREEDVHAAEAVYDVPGAVRGAHSRGSHEVRSL